MLALTVVGDADHQIVHGDANADDDLTLQFDVATNVVILESNVSADRVSFPIPNDSLTLKLRDGDDSISIQGLGPSFTADLIVEGGDGKDSITVASDLLVPGHDIDFSSESVVVDSGVTISTRTTAGGAPLTAPSTGDSGNIQLNAATDNVFNSVLGLPTLPAPVEIVVGDDANLLSHVETGSAFAPGDIALKAEETSLRLLRLVPIGIDFKDASISIDGANLQGANVSITAQATDISPLSEAPAYVDGFLGNLQSLINQVPGILVSSFTGISASVMVRGANANVDLTDSSIFSSGSVTINSKAGADASLESIAVSSPLLPYGVAVGFGRATASSTVDLLGSSEIIADGNVSIGSDASVKAKVTSRVSSNLGTNGKDVDPNDMSLAMSVANTDLDSRTTVSEQTTISSRGNVSVDAKGTVDVKPDARTGAFGDGIAGIGISLAFDETDVNAIVNGRIDAVGIEVNVFDPTTDVDLVANTISLAGHGLTTGQAIMYRSGDAGEDIAGLTDGDTFYVIVIDADTFQLSAVPSINLDNSEVDPAATHSLNVSELLDFTPSDPGVVDVANDAITLFGHGLLDGQAVTYLAPVDLNDDGSAPVIEGLAHGTEYEVILIDADSFQLRDLFSEAVVDLAGDLPLGTHSFSSENTTLAFSPSNDVDADGNTITIPGHGLSTGDAVVYRTDPTLFQQFDRPVLNEDGSPVTNGEQISITAFDTPIRGLDARSVYFVTVVNANTIRLSETDGDSLAAVPIDLASLGAGDSHSIKVGGANGINISADLSAKNAGRIDGKAGGSRPKLASPEDGGKFSNYVAPATKAENIIQIGNLLVGRLQEIGGSDESGQKDKLTNDTLSAGAGVTINYFEHDVRATIGSTADLNSKANVAVVAKATQKTQLRGQSGASKDGDGVSVAAAIGIGIYNNDVQAIVDSGASIDAAQAITVKSTLTYPLLKHPLDVINPVEFFKGGIGGLTQGFLNGALGFNGSLFNTWVFTTSKTGGGLAALAGSVAITDYTNISKATIHDGAQINQDVDARFRTGTQSVDVTAKTSMELVEMSGIGSLGLNLDGLAKLANKSDPYGLVNPFGTSNSKGGVGGSALFTFFDNTTIATIDSNVDVFADDRLTVRADQDIMSFAFAQSGGDARTFGISGSFTVLNHDTTTRAHIASGATVSGSGSVDVATRDEMTRINIAGAIQKGKSIGIGVSAAINVVDRDAEAFIGERDTVGNAGTTINVGGDVNVDAETVGSIYSFSLAGVAISNEATEPTESDDEDALDGVSLPNLFSETDDEDDTRPSSNGGPKTGVGVAGSASINVVNDSTRAFINDRVTIFADDVSVTSLNDVGIVSASGAAAVVNASGSDINAGLAGAFSFNQLDQTTQAFVRGADITTLATANDDEEEVTVSADREGFVFAFSGGLAGGNAKDGVAAAGSVSISRIDNSTDAFLDGVQVTTDGDLAIHAKDTSQIISIGGGATFPDQQGNMASFGFGASIGLNQISNSTRAEIRGDQGRSRVGTSSGNAGEISIEAVNDNAIRALGVSAGAGQSVGAAFTLGINLISDVIQAGNIAAATIGNADIFASNVRLDARDDSNIQAIGGAFAFGGSKFGFGAALGWNQISTDTQARITASDVIASGSVTLTAASTESTPLLDDKIVSVAIGAAVANGVALGGSLSINVIDAVLDASVDDSSVEAASDVVIKANDSSTIRAIGGGFAVADVGAFGAAIGTNVITNDVLATINAAQVAGTNLDVEANSESEITAISLGGSFSASTIQDTPDPDADEDDPLDGASLANLFDEDAPSGETATSIAGAGSVSGNVIANSTEASIRSSNVDFAGTVEVIADGESKIEVGAGAVALSIAGGAGGANSVSIGGSLAANVIVDSVDAIVEQSAVDSSSTTIMATSNPSIVSVSLAGTGGVAASVDAGLAASGAGTISVNVITNSTEARLLGDSSISSRTGDVVIAANDDAQIVSAAGAGTLAGAFGPAGGIGVNVGAAISFNTITSTISATVDESNIVSARHVAVTAKQDADISAASLGIAGSAAFGSGTGKTFSLAGSATISTIASDLEASIKSSTIESVGDLSVSAANNSTIGSGAGGAAVAGAGGASGGTGGGIGASFALNVINNEVDALIESSTVDAGGAIVVDAKSTADIYTFTVAVSGAGAGGADASTGIAGAGSGSINVVANRVAAEVLGTRDSDRQLIASSSVTGDSVVVRALDDSTVTAAAGAGTVAGAGGTGAAIGAGLGASLAINSITNAVTALVDGVTLEVNGNVDATATSNAEITAVTVGLGLGAAGSTAGALGIQAAASGSGNGIGNDVQAMLRESTVNAGGAINVVATDDSNVKSFAGGVSGAGGFGASASGAAAVGSSFASNVITNHVDSRIEGSSATAQAASVEAVSNADIVAATIGFAAGASGSASGAVTITLAGAGSVNVVTNDIDAGVMSLEGKRSDVTTDGDVRVVAMDDSKITAAGGSLAVSAAGGPGGGISTQAGASVSVNVITNDVTAVVEGSDVHAGANFSVTTSEQAEIISATIGFAAGAGLSAGGGIAFTLGASNSFNTINNNTLAAITDDSSVEADGTVSISATDSANIHAFAGSAALTGGGGAAGGGAAAIGASLAVNEIGNTVQSVIENSTVAGALDITIESKSAADVVATTVAFAGSLAGGAGGGISFAGTGAGSINIITNDVDARIGDTNAGGSEVESETGNVSVNASDNSTVIATAGASSVSGGGGAGGGVSGQAGASFAVNVITNDVTANVDASNVTAANVSVKAIQNADIIVTTIGFAAGGSGGAAGGLNIAVGGSISGNAINNDVEASITNSSTVDASGSATVMARDDSHIKAFAGGASGGGSGGAGGGATGAVGSAFAVNEVGNAVKSVIESSTVNTRLGLDMDAISSAEIISATIGFAGTGGGGAGGGVNFAGAGAGSVNLILNDVDAVIRNNSIIMSNENLAIDAMDDSNIIAVAGAVAVSGGGGAGGSISGQAGASIATNVINNAVRANVDNSDVTASSQVAVTADESALILSNTYGFGVGGGGGAGGGFQVSAASSISGNGINNDVEASITGGSDVESQSSEVRLTAVDDSEIATTAGGASGGGAGGAGGGAVGAIGASAAVNEIGNNVVSLIEASEVTAGTGVHVNATESADITTATFGFAVGAAGGAGGGIALAGSGAGSVNIITNNVEARIGQQRDVDGIEIPGTRSRVTAEGDVIITAADDSRIIAAAGSASISGSGGGIGGVSVQAGASTGVNVVENTVAATIDGATVDSPNAVNLLADSSTEITVATVGFSAGGSGGAIGGVQIAAAGSSSKNVIINSVDASINASDINARTVDVMATDSALINALAGGAAGGGSGGGVGGVAVALAGSFAVNIIDNDTAATIANSTVTTTRELDVAATADSHIRSATLAGAGTGSGGGVGGVAIGGAGTVSVNHITSDVLATIVDGSSITTLDGEVNVLATDSSLIEAGAGAGTFAGSGGAVGGVSVSIGAAVTENEITTSTVASIHDSKIDSNGIDGVGNTRVVAMSEASILTDAIGLSTAVSGGVFGLSATGVGATTTNLISGAGVQAVVQGSTVDAEGDLEVKANDAASIRADAGGAAAALAIGGGAVSVSAAASMAINQIDRPVLANIHDSDVNANGVFVNADGATEIDALAFAGAGSISGGVGLSISLAGSAAIAINRISSGAIGSPVDTPIEATVTGGSDIVADGVNVRARDMASIDAIGVAGSFSVSAAPPGFSGSLALATTAATNEIHRAIVATVDRSATDGVFLGVAAESTSAITAHTIAAGLSGSAAIAGATATGGGAGSTNAIDNQVHATVSNSQVDASSGVIVAARDNATIDSTVGAEAVSIGTIALSVGASVADNTITNDVLALIEDSNVESEFGNADVTAESTTNTSARSIATSQAIGVGNSVAAATATSTNETEARSLILASTSQGGSVKTPAGNVNVTATSNNMADARSFAESLGLISVSAFDADAHVGGLTDARVNLLSPSATIETNSLNVAATSNNTAEVDVVVTNIAAIAGSGGNASATIDHETVANLTSAGTVNSTDRVDVLANSIDNARANAAGGTASLIDVSVLLTEADIQGRTQASIGASTNVVTGDILVAATSLNGAQANTNLVGIGAISGQGGTATSTIGHSTTSLVQQDADLQAERTVRIESDATNNADADALGASASFLGVAVHNAAATVTGAVESHLGENVSIVANELAVNALSDANADSDLTTAAGGFVSTAVAAATSVVRPTIGASIFNGSTISAGKVDVVSDSQGVSIADANGVAGGGVAVAASIAKAIMEPTIRTLVADGVEIQSQPGLIVLDTTIQSRHNYDTAPLMGGAQATARSSGVGALAAVGADADARSIVDVETKVAQGANLNGERVRIESLVTSESDAQAIPLFNTVALIGVGTHRANADAGGSTRSLMDGQVVASLFELDTTTVYDADAKASAGVNGLLAGLGAETSANIVDATLARGAESTSSIGDGASVLADFRIDVRTNSTTTAHAESKASTNSLVGIGATKASAVSQPIITTRVGRNVVLRTLANAVSGNYIQIEASHNSNLPTHRQAAFALAESTTSTIAGSVNVNDANAQSTPTVATTIDIGSTLESKNDVIVRATSAGQAVAEANGDSAGFVGVGAVDAHANQAGSISTFVFSSQASPTRLSGGRDVIVEALSSDQPEASATASRGGVFNLVNINGADANAQARPAITAQVLGFTNITAARDVQVNAQSTTSALSEAQGKQAATNILNIAQFGRSNATTIVEPQVAALLDGTVQAGGDVQLRARHIANKKPVPLRDITGIVGTVSHNDPEIIAIEDPEGFVSSNAFAASSSHDVVSLLSGQSARSRVISNPDVDAVLGFTQPGSRIEARGDVTIESDSQSDVQSFVTNRTTANLEGLLIAEIDAGGNTNNQSQAVLGDDAKIVTDGDFTLRGTTTSVEGVFAIGRANSTFSLTANGDAIADARLDHNTIAKIDDGASVDAFGDVIIDASDRTDVSSVAAYVSDATIAGAFSEPHGTARSLVGRESSQNRLDNETGPNNAPLVASGEESVPNAASRTFVFIQDASIRGSNVQIAAVARQLEVDTFGKGKAIGGLQANTNADGFANTGVLSDTDVVIQSGAEILAADQLKLVSVHQRNIGSNDLIRTSAVARGDTDNAATGNTDAIAANVSFLSSIIRASEGASIRTESLEATAAIPKLYYHVDTDRDAAISDPNGEREEYSRSELERRIELPADITIIPFIELLIGEDGEIIRQKRVAVDASSTVVGQRGVEAPVGPLSNLGRVTLNLPFPLVIVNDESSTGSGRRTDVLVSPNLNDLPDNGLKLTQNVIFDDYNVPATGSEIRLVNRSDDHLRLERLTADTITATRNYALNTPRSLELFENSNGSLNFTDEINGARLENSDRGGGVGGPVSDDRYEGYYDQEREGFRLLQTIPTGTFPFSEPRVPNIDSAHIQTNALIRSTKKDVIFAGLVDLPTGDLKVVVDEVLANDLGGVQTRDGHLVRVHSLDINAPGNVAVANNDTPDGIGFPLDPLVLEMVNDGLNRIPDLPKSTIRIDATRGDTGQVDIDVRLLEKLGANENISEIDAQDLFSVVRATGNVKIRNLASEVESFNNNSRTDVGNNVLVSNLVSDQGNVEVRELVDDALIGRIIAANGTASISIDDSIRRANVALFEIEARRVELRSREGRIGVAKSGAIDPIGIVTFGDKLVATAQGDIYVNSFSELRIDLVDSELGSVGLTTLEGNSGNNDLDLTEGSISAAGNVRLLLADNFRSGVINSIRASDVVLRSTSNDQGSVFEILGPIISPTVTVTGSQFDDQVSIAQVRTGSEFQVFTGLGDDAILLVPDVFDGGTTSDIKGNLSIHGEAGIDSVQAAFSTNTWSITGDDQGNVIGENPFSFEDVESLIGNELSDTFVFSDQTAISGLIDGRGDIDKLDYAAYTTPVTVDLLTNFASNVAMGVFNIEELCDPTDLSGIPRVNYVGIRSTRWAQPFVDAIDPLRRQTLELSNGADQLLPLPWIRLDEIQIGFTKDIGTFDSSLLGIHGVNVFDYVPLVETVQYDALNFTVTIQLNTPLESDKLLITIDEALTDADGNSLDGEWMDATTSNVSGDGNVGGDFRFRFNVLLGDVDQDGEVRLDDSEAAFDRLFGQASDGIYIPTADINGDGQIRANDSRVIFGQHFESLPSAEPSETRPIPSPVPPLPNATSRAADVALLTAYVESGSNASFADVNQDNKVDKADLVFMVESVFATQRGDTDLDGDVDFADFLNLSANFGNRGSDWSRGDFGLDGTVGFDDFLYLSDSFGVDQNNR